MASKQSIGNLLAEADLKGKKVLLHADLNVPLDDDQMITDDTSIRASVPTIKFLMEKGAKVILASPLGRPKGVTPKYSLKPLVPRLSELLEVDVIMANNCVGEEVRQLATSLPDGGVLLFEFYEEEEIKNDPEFAKKLASVADIYVNDAFAHRAPLDGETLSGIFAFDINDGIDTVTVIKNGLPDNMSHHISTDDGVSSELPIGKNHSPLPAAPGAFTYEFTSGGDSVVAAESRQKDKVSHHISIDGGASSKVQQGKGLPGVGVFDWSDDDGESGMEDKKVIHHISADSGRARIKVQEGKGLPGVFVWNVDNSVIDGESGMESKAIQRIE